jgi:hypothetical protein
MLIQIAWASGQTVYIFLWNSSGQIWNTNTNAFETESDPNIPKYAVASVQQGSTATYFATVPVAITTPGSYTWQAYVQLGAQPAAGDTLIGQGPFIIPSAATPLTPAPSTMAALILSLRAMADDLPDSKISWQETLGSSDQPAYQVNGSNTLFKLKHAPLSDYAGAAIYSWASIVGAGATVRSQTIFTIVDQVNGIISFTSAPNPGTAQGQGVYLDYNWQWYTDAKYNEFLSRAAGLTVAGSTPLQIPEGLLESMMQFGLYELQNALATRFAQEAASSGGEARIDAQTKSQAFRVLAKDSMANGINLQKLYYQRQGGREAPAWGNLTAYPPSRFDKITPIR